MNPTINIQVSGRYKCKALNPETKEILRETDWFSNVITNIGMNQIADTAIWPYAHVGTGNAPALETNTSLEAFVATDLIDGAATAGNSGVSPYYAFSIGKYTFALGAVVGNMAEVGVSHDNDPNALCSRALIVDGVGSPTTFTVNADEIFEMEYEYRFYPPEADSVTNILDTDSGITHDVTMRTGIIGSWVYNAANLGANPRAQFTESDLLAAIDSSSDISSTATYTDLPYVADSHQKVYRLTAGLTAHNYPTGIGGAAFYSGQVNGFSTNVVRASFNPKILKTSLDQLEVDLIVSWARRP